MSNQLSGGIEAHFQELEDPRQHYLYRHPLINILTIALCGIIAGAESWVDIENFGNQKKDWLAQHLDLENGIPSHDTFGRVFSLLDPDQFRKSFLSWVQGVFEITQGQVIALDGKQLRRSHDQTLGKGAIQMVSAWATVNHLVLGQVKVSSKSNEITAIPKLLRLLDISNCIITIDGIGTQTEIVAQIVQQGGDYLLPVKQNQANLYDDIALFFKLAQKNEFQKVDHTYYRMVDNRHGRMEIRQCWAISGEDSLAFLRGHGSWKGLQTLVMIYSERHVKKKIEKRTSYFISSIPNNAEHLLKVKRSHWGIENELHWVLDVAFREDDSRVRIGHAAENLAVIRHMALNLLKQEKSAKGGVKAKRLQAAWNNDYLVKVISG